MIEAMQSIGPHEMKSVATAYEKVATHKAASEAGKRLMAENADWLGPENSTEVRICSALEWQPMEDRAATLR